MTTTTTRPDGTVFQVVLAQERGDLCYAGRRGWHVHELGSLSEIVEGSVRGPYSRHKDAYDAAVAAVAEKAAARPTPASQHEAYKLVCLSTAHLEAITARFMERQAEVFPFIVAIFREGFFVSCQQVAEEDETGQHPSLHACRLWAAAQGYQYLMLDADGPHVEELPRYDW